MKLIAVLLAYCKPSAQDMFVESRGEERFSLIPGAPHKDNPGYQVGLFSVDE